MSFANSLKQEIARVSRKEIKANTDSTRRAVAQFRRDIAELKRVVKTMERRMSALEKEEKKRVGKPVAPDLAEGARFGGKWVRSHRHKIGLSQADYARLVGVSSLTIYNWESGRTRPRREQLNSWVAVRTLGKRDAERRLELLG
jgi:DNA-binding transcriptional regulator YiaG